MSTKSEKYKRSIRNDREDWRSLWRRCFICSRHGTLDVHEIEKKSSAPLAWGERCNYLALCSSCHWDVEHHPAFWTHARQLALKQRIDSEHYDLAAWLAIKPRPATYVTQDEVDEFLNRRIA